MEWRLNDGKTLINDGKTPFREGEFWKEGLSRRHRQEDIKGTGDLAKVEEPLDVPHSEGEYAGLTRADIKHVKYVELQQLKKKEGMWRQPRQQDWVPNTVPVTGVKLRMFKWIMVGALIGTMIGGILSTIVALGTAFTNYGAAYNEQHDMEIVTAHPLLPVASRLHEAP